MSAFLFTCTTAPVALTAATAKTTLQVVAAANHRVKCLAAAVSFDGTSSSAVPVKVEFYRQTTAGTMSALTPRKVDDSIAETLQTAAQHTATAEPTNGDLLDSWYVHPQAGTKEFLPFSQEFIIGGGDRVGFVLTAPAGVNVITWFKGEE